MLATSSSPTARRSLVGLGRGALATEMADFGAEPFRARQLWHWIYHRGVTDFAAMTSLSREFRERLAAHFELRRAVVFPTLISSDGTREWPLQFREGQAVGTVHIPEADRVMSAVSTY